METIKLTPNGEYIGVVLPKDAINPKLYRVNYESIMMEWENPVNPFWENNIYISSKGGKDNNWKENYFIIGELSNLTEEQAREIVELNEHGFYNDYMGNTFYWNKALPSLSSLIESKGVKVKNPNRRPNFQDYPPKGEVRNMGDINESDYKHDLMIWESSERELKTIVLIKSKKTE